jgi:DNA-binding transcriptional LysR family regulator
MRLEQLSAFVTLAEELNYRRAASRLYLSQPTLTGQVHDLEHQLGVRLFERGRDGTRLTAEGRRLLTYAQDVLLAFGDLVGAATDVTATGRRVRRRFAVGLGPGGIGPATWPVLECLHLLRPDLQLVVTSLTFSSAVPALRTGRVDVLLTHGPLDDGGPLHVTTVAEVPVAVILPRNHPLATRPCLDLDTVVPHFRFVPPAEMGREFRRFWLVEDHSLAGEPVERLHAEEADTLARHSARRGALGLWPSDVPVPTSSGAVLRRLSGCLGAPLQLATRATGPEFRDLLLAARHVLAGADQTSPLT